jgi:hypothetical protein
MSWPAPTRADHDKFCRTEGWKKVRDATGRIGTHHITYELALPDGRILRTRISRPPDRTTYGPSMWSHILRDQLDVDEATFWAAVRDGRKPARTASTAPSAEALPTEVAFLLVNRVGLSREEVAAMTKEEAIQRLNRYWAEGT